ncbi:MAG: hypothetical protein EU536_01335 [Promethearchaeota archaeon]|nr:MAG: hypothetical protein EU536_01335 [Candidatus Lokiarchaeota archaeon]
MKSTFCGISSKVLLKVAKETFEMKLIEKQQDLFTVNLDEWIPVHCISMDCKMSAGIAVTMRKRFNLGEMAHHPPEELTPPTCLFFNGVMNLITKKKYWQKPTYESLKTALLCLKNLCNDHQITKIVMPRIGSGLDRLSWSKVRQILKEMFQDTEIIIQICYLK